MPTAPSHARWPFLAATTFARAVVGFQFQALPALGPSLRADLSLGLAEIGVLTGLFMAPGVVVALTAGALLQRFSVRGMLAGGLLVMTAGAVAAGLSADLLGLSAARIAQGVGGVLVIVAALKGVHDRFAEQELAIANAVSGAAHPFGMGVALMLFPALGAGFDWRWGSTIAGAAAAAALAALLVSTRADAAAPRAAAGFSDALRFTRREAAALLAASMVVALFAGGFHAFLSLLPAHLAGAAWSPGAAAAILGLFGWAPIVVAPIGGVLIARGARPGVLIPLCLTLWGAAAVGLALIGVTAWLVGLMLIVGPLILGPVMSLGAGAVAPERRGVASGVFMAGFFFGNAAMPALAAGFGERAPEITGAAEASAILLCGVAFAGALIPYLAFRAMTARRFSR